MAVAEVSGVNPLAFEPPSPEFVETLVRPLRAYFSPKFYGLERVDPARPTMFVANHTLYALLDPALYIAELYRTRHVFPRAMGDYLIFRTPAVRAVATQLGVVRGDRETCARLMRAGQPILVFPGGAREAAKRKGEQYRLHWSDHLGFARLAIEHGYDVVPIGSVGPDEAWRILIDGDELMRSPIGKLMRLTGLSQRYLRNGELLYPLVRGIGLTGLPRPVRFYIGFGPAIRTSRYRGVADYDQVREFRDQVEAGVDAQIDDMLLARENDARPGLVRRMLSAI